MNNKRFHEMQEQLRPRAETLTALKERLAETVPVQAAKPRWGRYVALAACAALVVAAVPVYGALNPPLHAYALGAAEPARRELALGIGDLGGGVDGTHPILPGGAALVERPVQEEATAAYEALMARFAADYGPGSYPDWYGGSYIDDWGGLIVCVVDAPVEDKSLYLEIQDMCGGHSVGFRDASYTLAQLNALQDRVVALLGELDFADQLWASGVDEERNQVAVTLPFASKKALAGLHKLDPAGDAIAVTVTERQPVELTAPEEPTSYPIDPAPDVSVQITPEPQEKLPMTEPLAEEPAAVSTAPDVSVRTTPAAVREELPVPEPMAEEPHYDLLELPEDKEPAELPDYRPAEATPHPGTAPAN